MVATVVANTLNTAVFGAAAFAQPALGQAFLAGQQNALDLYNRIYAAPLFGTVLLGLLLFIIGGFSPAYAIATSGFFPTLGRVAVRRYNCQFCAQRLLPSVRAKRHNSTALRSQPHRRLERRS